MHQHKGRQFRYWLDAHDTIQAVDKNWLSFAEENDTPSLNESTVLGQPIWKFIAGSETQSLYRQLYQKVRDTKSPITIPFRCDSSTTRRFMELRIESEDQNNLAVTSTLARQESRDPIPLMEYAEGPSTVHLTICSMCLRMSIAPFAWNEVEDIIQQLGLFMKGDRPQLNQRICPTCERIAEGCRYLIDLPEQDLPPTSKLPLLIFLHGARHNQWLLRLQAPPRLFNNQSRPLVLASPLNSHDGQWDLEYVEVIIDEILEQYPVDQERIYLTGISVGAHAIWKLAQRDPTKYAALVPVAGMGNTLEASKLSHLPIWMFHGEHDPIVSSFQVNAMARALQNHDGSPKLTIYPNTTHDAWSQAYHNNELWDWLLDQRRTVA